MGTEADSMMAALTNSCLTQRESVRAMLRRWAALSSPAIDSNSGSKVTFFFMLCPELERGGFGLAPQGPRQRPRAILSAVTGQKLSNPRRSC